jgi:hypothetical protein
MVASVRDLTVQGDQQAAAGLEMLVGDRATDARLLGEATERECVGPITPSDLPGDPQELSPASVTGEPLAGGGCGWRRDQNSNLQIVGYNV